MFHSGPGLQSGRAVKRFGDLWRGRYRPTLLPGRGRLMERDMHALLLAFVSAIMRERDARRELERERTGMMRGALPRSQEVERGIERGNCPSPAREERRRETQRESKGSRSAFSSSFSSTSALHSEVHFGDIDQMHNGTTQSEASHKFMKEGAFEVFSFLFYRKRFSCIHQAAALESQEEVWQLILVVWQELLSLPPSVSAFSDSTSRHRCPSSGSRLNDKDSDGFAASPFPSTHPCSSSDHDSRDRGTLREDMVFPYRVGCLFLLLWLLYTAPFSSRIPVPDRAFVAPPSAPSSSPDSAAGNRHSTPSEAATGTLENRQTPEANVSQAGCVRRADSERDAGTSRSRRRSGCESEEDTRGPDSHAERATHKRKDKIVLPAVATLSAENVELLVDVAQACLKRGELLDGARTLKVLWSTGKIRVSVFPEPEEACDKRGLPLGVNKALLFASLQRQPVSVERPHAANLKADIEAAVLPYLRVLEELPSTPLLPRDQHSSLPMPPHSSCVPHRARGRGGGEDRRVEQVAGVLQGRYYPTVAALQRLGEEEPLPWVDDKLVVTPSTTSPPGANRGL
ncbi:hypothetical protein TGME49_226460 [Toxoplasma gondii ME49]|uniref:Uncharacterized protein n=1 Tax=Toxoplasma gondii (strain ATCC 50611 / Me49) TaxID=508771 RepID=S8EUM8_TOXGM|nr:hypothetical protein TGME49_226460 [Toxoplasma gondii ME49]EPT27141.1 hypothetical protein TGME49_226460 [Toxoplasma gondii ME49]|eukprot:XP_018636031.1 hypothetical protein TGME49_226460 [Toxoplasma gondii ME49]